MKEICRRIVLITVVFLLTSHLVYAAPGSTAINKVRFSQTPESIRIVFDMDTVPEYTVNPVETPLSLVVDMSTTVNKSGLPQILFNDPVVSGMRLEEIGDGKLRVVVNLKSAVNHKVFGLVSPNRLVIDIIKSYEHKDSKQIMPGLKYTYWQHGMPSGSVRAHILDIDPRAGFILKPVLSNDMIPGLEALSSMAARTRAVAAVNGSYFGKNGDILGVMKMEGELVSVSSIPRSVIGGLSDGKFLIDQVAYQGYVELPDGKTIDIDGINCERYGDRLVLFNSYYGYATGTNAYGAEYVIENDKVVAIGIGNSPIVPARVVLSAHGEAAKQMSSLKVGDTVKIVHSLGQVWDNTIYALGAGPMLLKNGNIFLTTKIEEFGSDVAGGRAPRTAFGLTKDGHVLLVVVEGRDKTSMGLTLLELASFMQELGAVDAMNLDGGGSSEMVINDRIVSRPSDGRERNVGNALAVVSAKLAY